MKIRIKHSHLNKIEQTYMKHLAQYIYKPMTPRLISEMEVALEHIKRHMKVMDAGNPAWDIPVKIIVTSPGTFEVQLQLDNVEIVG